MSVYFTYKTFGIIIVEDSSMQT